MKRVWAIAWLTFREGIRMRVVLVFLVLLVLLVLLMPSVLRGDETLAGRLQNFLSYAMGALGFLLSLATIFFSCMTLSQEFERRSLHMVVTKPVTRFQVLLGKWLGVNLLNVLIIILCGCAIYGLARFIRAQPEQFERDRHVIEDVVWTARAIARPTRPDEEFTKAAMEYIDEKIANGEVLAQRRTEEVAQQIKTYRQRWRVLTSGEERVYRFENLATPKPGTTFQVRYKAIAQPVPPDEKVTLAWVFLDPETDKPLGNDYMINSARSTERHQFLASDAAIRNGTAVLAVWNPWNPARPTTVIFDGQDSLQLLYRVGSFEGNFVRALLIVLLRLALLSALGVFFSVFVSFPVACLCTVAFYLICLGMPFWLESVGADSVFFDAASDPYGALGPAVRALLVPAMRTLFPNFVQYDGGSRLVDGGYVSYTLLGRCALHTLVYGGALLLIPGWLIFRRREVAEVQV
jgi:hypothetical protein